MCCCFFVCECHYIWFVGFFSVLSLVFCLSCLVSFHSLCWTNISIWFDMIVWPLHRMHEACNKLSQKKIWNCETKSKLLKNTWILSFFLPHKNTIFLTYLDCALELCFTLKCHIQIVCCPPFQWQFLVTDLNKQDAAAFIFSTSCLIWIESNLNSVSFYQWKIESLNYIVFFFGII